MQQTTTGEADGVALSAEPGARPADEAVSALRRVQRALLRGGGTTAALADVAARLHALADELETTAPPTEDRMAEMWQATPPRHDPVTGPENPLAPPMRLHGRADGSVDGTTVLDLPYQGPPGHVHGGVTALLLDHTLGTANAWAGTSGMTAELTLRYQRPTPLFEPLEVAAHQVAVEGRRIRTSGTVSARGRVCVRAEGVFVDKRLPKPRARVGP
ncbi:PaaI family thioesterase [Streptomyces xiaopingdaonensis]|uniref:PaaI family thioesterase n=1 Tax=Streptomyces xiaopingdaonensis TaxID=1565415 RepID=UPI0005259ABA|nr:PaaI family thioesterase [Streptomyces xiaopingdaonensis]